MEKFKSKSIEKGAALEIELEGMIDLNSSSIRSYLLKDETNNTYQNPVSPPNSIVDSSSSLNHFYTQFLEKKAELFTTQDKELFSVLKSIQNMNYSFNSKNRVLVTTEGRISG